MEELTLEDRFAAFQAKATLISDPDAIVKLAVKYGFEFKDIVWAELDDRNRREVLGIRNSDWQITEITSGTSCDIIDIKTGRIAGQMRF